MVPASLGEKDGTMSTSFPQYAPRPTDPTAYANPTVPPSASEPSAPATATPGYASSTPPHPTLDLLVTPQQRERGERFLQEAYADGRLTHAEFEVRLDQVLGATTRRELNQAFYGLVAVPPTSQALGLHPAYRPSLINQGADGRTGKAMAATAHFSGLFFWIFGPLVMYMLGTKGSYAKRQAAAAFNWQVYSSIGLAGAFMVAMTTEWGVAGPLALLAWFVLTIVGGVRASQGERDTNPVSKRIPWKPLNDR